MCLKATEGEGSTFIIEELVADLTNKFCGKGRNVVLQIAIELFNNIFIYNIPLQLQKLRYLTVKQKVGIKKVKLKK